MPRLSPDSLRSHLPVARPPIVVTLAFTLAVILAGAYALVVGVVSVVLQLFPLAGIPASEQQQLSDEQRTALQQTASERIWPVIILIVLVLVVIVLLTIIQGRRALRQVGSATTPRLLAKAATSLLVGSLLLALLNYLCSLLRYSGTSGVIMMIMLVLYQSSETVGAFLVMTVVPAGMMASFVLSALVVGQHYQGYPQSQGRRWRIAAGVDLAVSLLLWLAWAIYVAIVSSRLHLGS